MAALYAIIIDEEIIIICFTLTRSRQSMKDPAFKLAGKNQFKQGTYLFPTNDLPT